MITDCVFWHIQFVFFFIIMFFCSGICLVKIHKQVTANANYNRNAKYDPHAPWFTQHIKQSVLLEIIAFIILFNEFRPISWMLFSFVSKSWKKYSAGYQCNPKKKLGWAFNKLQVEVSFKPAVSSNFWRFYFPKLLAPAKVTFLIFTKSCSSKLTIFALQTIFCLASYLKFGSLFKSRYSAAVKRHWKSFSFVLQDQSIRILAIWTLGAFNWSTLTLWPRSCFNSQISSAVKLVCT